MSVTAEQILTAALSLPDDDRLEVVEALLASLHPPYAPPLDDAWREVVIRRSSELRTGAVTPVPWADVKRQLREDAGG